MIPPAEDSALGSVASMAGEESGVRIYDRVRLGHVERRHESAIRRHGFSFVDLSVVPE
ncbi:MAG: hypothetical protein QOD92_3777 [Acidimicrobiaceae bacterium]|jgi:hypothetical protein